MGRVHRAGFLLILGLGLATPAAAAEQPPGCEMKELADRFVAQFLEGKHDPNLELMNETMRAAAGPPAWEQLRAGLTAQNGPLREPGKAWVEDTVQGNLRLRVPVHYERATIDFRVVVDEAGKVTGFFLEPHVEPPDAGSEHRVSIGEGQRALPATLTLPTGKGPHPAVVLIHGSGPNDRDETVGPNKIFRDLAWGLAERGVATLRYDKRSLVHPEQLIALGDALTVEHEVIDDARTAMAFLRSRPEIDASRLFVVGHSLGGHLAPRIAAAEPRPAGIVALAGFALPLPEKLLEQARYLAAFDDETTAAKREHVEATEREVARIRAALDGIGPEPTGYVLGVPIGYYRDLEAHDPPTDAARLGLPILVLQGESDYQVTMADFERWRAALDGKPFSCLASYERLDHHFRVVEGPSGPADYARAAPFSASVIDDLAAWILDRTCPRMD